MFSGMACGAPIPGLGTEEMILGLPPVSWCAQDLVTVTSGSLIRTNTMPGLWILKHALPPPVVMYGGIAQGPGGFLSQKADGASMKDANPGCSQHPEPLCNEVIP